MPTPANLNQLIEQALAAAASGPESEPSVAARVAASQLTVAQVAALIDHTLLKPDAGAAQIRQLCAEAMECGFFSVCVHPTWVTTCGKILAGTAVKTCTVIGFPHGATLGTVKAREAVEVLQLGAQEVDMVLNMGRLKDQDYATVYADIAGVAEAAHDHGALAKVIIETALLTQTEKVAACVIAQQACIDFVKTATGFNGGGATVPDIMLMRQIVGAQTGVKASGGVRTAVDALNMVAAGATRIGTSGGVRIVQEWSTVAAANDKKADAEKPADKKAGSGDNY
jgi:deoxyribose-phosphate aldolase